jgi:hypothetical protein
MSPLSQVLEVKTKDDVPGPVTNHTVIEKNGLKLEWSPPVNRNGVLLSYLVEWLNRDGVQYAANVSTSETQFVFPNVTETDKLNISIRAIGTTGLGIPIYHNMFNRVEHNNGQQETLTYDPWIEVAIGSILGSFFILLCMCWCIRRKTCKKSARGDPQQTDLSQNVVAAHVTSINCTELHEMQTLIARQQIGSLPNGKHRPIEVTEYSDEPEKPKETSTSQGQPSLPELPHNSSKPLNGYILNQPNLKVLSSFQSQPTTG